VPRVVVNGREPGRRRARSRRDRGPWRALDLLPSA
jgi:hypothetical protein